MGMLDDEVEGYFLLGQNPAVGLRQRHACSGWACPI